MQMYRFVCMYANVFIRTCLTCILSLTPYIYTCIHTYVRTYIQSPGSSRSLIYHLIHTHTHTHTYIHTYIDTYTVRGDQGALPITSYTYIHTYIYTQSGELKEPYLSPHGEVLLDGGSDPAETKKRMQQANAPFLSECAVLTRKESVQALIEWGNLNLFRQVCC